VDRLAHILGRDKAQDRDLAGLGIDLDVAELRRETRRLAAGVDRGATLLLAGLAQPSSQTTPSTSTPQIIAARARNSSTSFLLASTTAMPVAKVTREPPVTCV
jgi:hypothetical protein